MSGRRLAAVRQVRLSGADVLALEAMQRAIEEIVQARRLGVLAGSAYHYSGVLGSGQPIAFHGPSSGRAVDGKGA